MARAANTTRKRPTRQSVNGKRDILQVEGKDEDFVYRIVNDVPGRVAEMKERGYELVEDENTKFSSSLDDSTQSGSVKRKYVGKDTEAVLMRIPKEWFEEDKAAKAKHVDRLEKTTQANNIKGGYGKVEIS